MGVPPSDADRVTLTTRGFPMLVLQALRGWGPRRRVAALVAAGASFVLLGVPTAVIPNPVFVRRIEAPGWTLPSLVITAALAGLLLATYVRDARAGGAFGESAEPSTQEARSFTAGGLLSFLAIGCPTCNKLVLIALGSSGAVTWFEPVQPILALAGIGVLVWALLRRLQGEFACALPTVRG